MWAYIRTVATAYALVGALLAVLTFAGWLISPHGDAAELRPQESVARPPAAYRGNTTAQIVTLDEPALEARCAHLMGPPSPGMFYRACTRRGRPVVYVPNPCTYGGDKYASVLCHELGHVNGWPGTHPGAIAP